MSLKYKSTLLAVKDIERAKQFYQRILGLEVTADFGANVTLAEHVCLQEEKSWQKFIGADETEITYRHKCGELYFETADFERFLERLKHYNIEYVHAAKEHDWGQKVVRFYDPDGNIIEIGESIVSVCRRFYADGLSIAEIAERMDILPGYVAEFLGFH